MKTIRRIAASFAMYSRIPLPHSLLREEDYENIIIFLPFTGIVIALVMYGVRYVMYALDCPDTAVICALILVPLALTGGFHADGFLDTVDALSSYGSADEKRKILSDPHVGSFAVIRSAMALLLTICAMSVLIRSDRAGHAGIFPALASVFVFSRIFAAFTSLGIKKAKEGGMLDGETRGAGKASFIFLAVLLLTAAAFTAYTGGYALAVILAAFTLFTLLYRRMVIRNFGGVSGDTAGFFVTAGEVFALAALALYYLLINRLT